MRISKISGAALLLLILAGQAQALTITTATINVTNQAGTTNGQTLVVNGDTRTWTNSVFAAGNQILTNNYIAGCTTNLFNQVADNPFANLSLTQNGTNGIILLCLPGSTITATLSPGWGTVTFTTNTLTSAQVVRVPITGESAGQQTNIASFLVLAFDLSTNSLSGTDVALSNYVSMLSAQTVLGAKQFTNTAGVWMGVLSNSPGIYNGTNYGAAFTSPGTNAGSEQFGAGATASGSLSTAVGNGANASGGQSAAFGRNAAALASGTTALGERASASLPGSTAVGQLATTFAPNATAIGNNAGAGNTNSTAVGYNAQTTANNQLMLGAAGISTVVQNYLNVGSGLTIGNGVTNLQATGTNFFPAGADLSFGRYALSTLANGNNAGVPVGTNVFVEVSGPSGVFTINGINGQPNRDGKLLFILNRTGQNMTIANDSGVDATAANRIYCLTAADKTLTGNSAATLIYSGAAAHWILLSFTQ